MVVYVHHVLKATLEQLGNAISVPAGAPPTTTPRLVSRVTAVAAAWMVCVLCARLAHSQTVTVPLVSYALEGK